MIAEIINTLPWPVLLLVGAVIWDKIIGDPRTSFHPVVLIGQFIGLIEKILLWPNHSVWQKRLTGAVLVFIVLTTTYEVFWYVVQFTAWLPVEGNLLIQTFLLSFTISPRSLAEAGKEIRLLLEADNIVEARKKVGWIVGRDTEKMTEAEATRATVETIAENIVDGIISPLFYAMIGGLPLAFLYRSVNTLDSMVGYRNEKYGNFGMVAARVDDIFNWIPARLTGLILILAAFVLKYDYKNAYRMQRRDAKKHPSPNSGFPESTVAGALGIQLGGLNYYGGMPSLRALMGDCTKILQSHHIEQVTKLMYLTTWLFVVLAAVLLQGLQHLGGLW